MPDPTLQAIALRYAAADLSEAEHEAFEKRLVSDQDARDALAEAVRLSAHVMGQKPPEPHPCYREAIRACFALRVRGYNPHAWVYLSAAAIAVCVLIAFTLSQNAAPVAESGHAAPAPRLLPAGDTLSFDAERFGASAITTPVAAAADDTEAFSDDQQLSVAELWAELSGTESVEKSHEDELRWRSRLRDLSTPLYSTEVARAAAD